MNRRRRLTAGVAVAAAMGGAGIAFWHRGGTPPAPDPAPTAEADAAGGAGEFWSLRFERPEGGELVLREWLGRPALINFWATWCPPCIKELPLLDAFHARGGHRGFRVVGLAIDGPTPVREFLARAPVRFDIGLAGLDGVAIGRSLGNATGALPFTVVCDATGRVVDRKLGELLPADLDRWHSRFAA